MPGLIGESTGSEEDPLADPKPLATRDCPRTLQDLVEMTSAAKEAQWGDQDESDASSTGFRVLGSNLYDEGSDASSESGDDNSEDLQVGEGSKELYESYCSDTHRSLVDVSPSGRDPSKGEDKRSSSDQRFGPSSDMLAPFVSTNHQ